MSKDKRIDKDWDGREPMTGVPMTGNIDSSYNYSTNGAWDINTENNVGYTPDMRADADRNRKPYDIKTDVNQGYNEDPYVKNNIASQEFDYTKEETGWIASKDEPTPNMKQKTKSNIK
jgi:hypothetical protein